MDTSAINILFVEDNADDARLIELSLEEAPSYTAAITRTHDLEGALSHLKAESFDLILLNLTLPDSSGLDTVATVYKEASDCPIIVLTGPEEEFLALEALRMGAQDHLVKGQIDDNILLRTVRYTVERHKLNKEIEESRVRLARTDRLETAGNVASQVAHDFNNLIQPFSIHLDTIRENLPPDSDGRKSVDSLDQLVHQMDNLISDMMSLSRRGRSLEDIFNVNDIFVVVRSRILEKMIPEGISIKEELADDLMNIKGDMDQFSRIFQNICGNAIDAMGNTGVLRVHTENIYLDNARETYDSVAEVGEYASVKVADTGKGIPIEIIEKIFDPFFTTKKGSDKKGTGLGMSIIRGIVRDHHGHIDLETIPTIGTTFTLYFPIHREKWKHDKDDENYRGSESIIIVDDDEAQIDMMQNYLTGLGYHITGFQKGEEVIEYLQTKETDLLILDIILGAGLDGLETYQCIQNCPVPPPTIMTCGKSVIEEPGLIAQSLNIDTHLCKPMNLKSLGSSVRKVLNLSHSSVADSRR